MTRARLLTAAVVMSIAFLVPVAHVAAPATRACSCMGPQPLATYAEEPQNVILAGTAGPRGQRGVPVSVDRWFAGNGAAPVVWIRGDFGNGASCGVGAAPPVGSQWLWVAWRDPADPLGDLIISICQPSAQLDTPAGQALFEEAVATFSGGAAPPPGDPAVSAAPIPSSPSVPVGVAAAAAAVLVAGVLVFGGVALLALRGRRHGT